MRSLRMSLPLLLPLIVFPLACSDDDKPTTPDVGREYFEPTTPENVLENFITAHIDQDIDRYGATIADNFEFRSTETGFETMNKNMDETVMTRMFAEVRDIEVALGNEGAVPSDLVDEFPADEGYMMIRVSAVSISVETTRDEGAGPITYLVQGDIALFVFEETSAGTWQIVMQEDHGTNGILTEETSWSSLKSLF